MRTCGSFKSANHMKIGSANPESTNFEFAEGPEIVCGKKLKVLMGVKHYYLKVPSSEIDRVEVSIKRPAKRFLA